MANKKNGARNSRAVIFKLTPGALMKHKAHGVYFPPYSLEYGQEN